MWRHAENVTPATLDRYESMTHDGPMADADELLTSPQVGAILGKSGRTISRLAADGTIPHAIKLPGPNGAYLFRRGDIEALRETA
jgi:predicted DNA-binding transcriptional regulator AlpA